MKRKIAALLIGCSILTSCWTTSFAASFPDLDSNTWGWAKTQIEEMSEKGIITGFPDGTFKPAEAVTKLQSLILISRIFGVNESQNSEYVKIAETIYADDLKSYSISNKKEIAYLLYKGVIRADELETYISKQNADLPLKRYEAAILLTKVMGSEKEVQNKLLTVLSYSDSASIPSHAKGYVEYVKDQNIMQGMSDTEFGPMETVTRAQMAVMLYRIIEKNLYEYSVGVVTEVDTRNDTIKIRQGTGSSRSYDIDEDVILKMNGENADLSQFEVGLQVIATLRDKSLFMLEGLSLQADQTVKGIVNEITKSGNLRKVTIVEDKDSADKKVYTIPDSAVIIYNGELSTIASINKDDVVQLDLRNGNVVKVIGESMTKVISGTIEGITSDSKILLTFKDKNGNIGQYEVLDNVTVRKNGKSSDLTSITIGDEADITLAYDKVKKIEASSDKDTMEGIIEEIVISKNPSIKIKKDGNSYQYPLSRDVQIKVDSELSNIYALKLGYHVKVNLESNTIVSMQVQRVEETQQITGVVELVNPSYYLVNIVATDAVTGESKTTQIFVKKGAKIINSASTSTKNLSVDDILVGDTITAIGTTSTGVFEATTVIILKRE